MLQRRKQREEWSGQLQRSWDKQRLRRESDYHNLGRRPWWFLVGTRSERTQTESRKSAPNLLGTVADSGGGSNGNPREERVGIVDYAARKIFDAEALRLAEDADEPDAGARRRNWRLHDARCAALRKDAALTRDNGESLRSGARFRHRDRPGCPTPSIGSPCNCAASDSRRCGAYQHGRCGHRQ